MYELKRIPDGGNSQRQFKYAYYSPTGGVCHDCVCVCVVYSTFMLLYCMLDIFIMTLLKF